MAEQTNQISEVFVHCSRTVTMTNYGSKTPDLQYTTPKGTFQLRDGWAGHYEKDGKSYAFKVQRKSGTSTPEFVVTDPAGNVHKDTIPTRVWCASGYVGQGTKVAGTTLFLLDSPILEDMNNTSCGLCSGEPQTVAEMEQ